MDEPTSIQVICPDCGVLNRIPRQKVQDAPLCGKCKHALLNGKPIPADDTNLQRYLEKSGLPVLVDFWAPWCGPCKQFAPIFREVASEMATQACFIKVDTQNNQQTAAHYRIRAIPTLALFYRGKEIKRMSGALSKGQLQQWLSDGMSTLAG